MDYALQMVDFVRKTEVQVMGFGLPERLGEARHGQRRCPAGQYRT